MTQLHLPMRVKHKPWFWRLYALRLEREVLLLRARVKELEKGR